MTRKDYKALAAALNAEANNVEPWLYPLIRDIATRMCDVFAADNPRFDADRFMAAVFTRNPGGSDE